MRGLAAGLFLVATIFSTSAPAQYGSLEEQSARRGCWLAQFNSTDVSITTKAQYAAINRCVTNALGHQDPYLTDMKKRFGSKWR